MFRIAKKAAWFTLGHHANSRWLVLRTFLLRAPPPRPGTTMKNAAAVRSLARAEWLNRWPTHLPHDPHPSPVPWLRLRGSDRHSRAICVAGDGCKPIWRRTGDRFVGWGGGRRHHQLRVELPLHFPQQQSTLSGTGKILCRRPCRACHQWRGRRRHDALLWRPLFGSASGRQRQQSCSAASSRTAYGHSRKNACTNINMSQ